MGHPIFASLDKTDRGLVALRVDRSQKVGKRAGILRHPLHARNVLDQEERGTKAWYSPVETYEEAKTALRWTLSRPVTSCVSPSHAELLWWMIEAEKELADLTALTPQEEKAIASATQDIAPIFPRR